jgi:predicted enzyme related to lactoylglutathione lyase
VADPLDILREPGGPVAPDPTFASRLRARLERALDLPRGVAVSTGTTDIRTDPAVAPAPPSAGAAIPYLAVRDARAAIDWYVDVFGAVLQGDPIVMPDGRIGHAELALAGGTLYLADEFPDIGVVAPAPDAAAVSLVLHVSDVDARAAAAVERGGTLTREISEAHGSRNATIVDPFGHRWLLQQPLSTGLPGSQPVGEWRQGDLIYISLWTSDVERAAAFYSSVLGWTYEPDHTGDPRARQVTGQAMAIGLWGGQPRTEVHCAYVVDDVDAAIARVRAAGGTASEPTQEPYGRSSRCVNPFGQPFSVHEPLPEAGPRAPLNGDRHGDLSYLTYQVRSSVPVRAFYTAVLGWTYTPGRIDDGWEVADVVPMSGIGGGADQAAVVPMWRVDDIALAVERVRAAGGTSTDPERQPYGISALCRDDQGMPFYLGQL